MWIRKLWIFRLRIHSKNRHDENITRTLRGRKFLFLRVDRIRERKPSGMRFAVRAESGRRRVACNSLFISRECFTVSASTLSHPREPFSGLKCKVKLIYIIFSLIASPDVRKLCRGLTECSMNYWNRGYIACALEVSMDESFISRWRLSKASYGLSSATLVPICESWRKWERERGGMWWEVVFIRHNNKQVCLRMNYLVPLFGKHTPRDSDRWRSQSRNIHLWYTGNHEWRVPRDPELSGWWTH